MARNEWCSRTLNECGSGWFKSLSESVAKVSNASTSVLRGKLAVCSRSITLRSLSSRQSAALDDCSRTITPPTARVGRRN